MRILPAGDRAVLVELADLDEVLRLYRQALTRRPTGVEEVVPAACTLLVRFDAGVLPQVEAARWVAEIAARQGQDGIGAVQAAGLRRVEIPVHYSGDDLDEVAQMLSLSRAELIACHTGSDYQAAFAGFAPGFVYLTGGDPRLRDIPRRRVPRTRVPAGSVAIAGGFGAVYPSDSPGGWRLLGVTPLRMWDLERSEPALIQPGFRVRFVDLDVAGSRRSSPRVSGAPEPPVPRKAPPALPLTPNWLEVADAGMQTVFQDLGRPGRTSWGISRSGALDRGAMQAANALVGNPSAAPVLENLMGGLRLVCHGHAAIAVTGARTAVSLSTASGMRLPAAVDSCLVLEDGQTLRLGRPRAGLRSYVAVQGGWDVTPVLGSCSTDILAGIGPAPLRKGDRLGLGRAHPSAPGPTPHSGTQASVPTASSAADSPPQPGDVVVVRVIPGPRDDWFDGQAMQRLLEQEWLVTPQSNRVGLRLAGDLPLGRARSGELPSEGMLPGAIEVPSSGQPLVFLADHPLTGGYPVIAVVVDRDLDRLGQVPPGARLKFRLA